MNAMSVSPVKPSLTPGSHDIQSIPTPPKIPMPTNSAAPPTNHNSFSYPEAKTPITRDIPLPPGPDKPLDLYKTVSKPASNGLSSSPLLSDNTISVLVSSSSVPPATLVKKDNAVLNEIVPKQNEISSEVPTKQSDVTVKQSDVIIKPSDVSTKPSDSPIKPSNVSTKPSDSPIKPSNAHIKPSDGHAKPSDAIIKSGDTHIKPADAHTKPIDVHTKPSDLHTTSSDIHIKPSDAFIKPCDTVVKPSEVSVKSESVASKPTDCSIKPTLASVSVVNVEKPQKIIQKPINSESPSKIKVEEPVTDNKIIECPLKEKESVKRKEIDVPRIEQTESKPTVSESLQPKEALNVDQVAKKRKHEPKTSASEQIEEESKDEEEYKQEGKPKRSRLPTQVYQSPLPELQMIEKLNTPVKIPKQADDKLIIFYKNEFLAVRNPEGSFYICQTFQNIHRGSHKIRIRWFTNLPEDVFQPDFCDRTEFDCILTNVQMMRLEKDKYKLPANERTRVENILKRALDVEQGVVEQAPVTEEHPDGLDLSLYKDEAQLKKRKRNATPRKKRDSSRKKRKTKQSAASSSKIQTPGSKAQTAGSKVQTPATKVQTSASKVQPSVSKVQTPASKVQASASKAQTPVVKKGPETSYLNPSVKLAINISAIKQKSKTQDYSRSARKSGASASTFKVTSKETPPVSTAKLVYAVKDKSKAFSNQKSLKKANSTESTNVNTSAKHSKKDKLKPLSKSVLISTPEKPTKVRSAGSAVTAKISSASTRMGKPEKDRKSATVKQRKK